MQPDVGIRTWEGARIVKVLIPRFRRRRGVSTIVGGLIVLSLILTALGTMIAVSQQYDQYQQAVNKIGQYENQQISENLVANSPGLTLVTSAPSSGWGSSCVTTTYTCYNMSLSNMGGVGVQIVTIYINSTGPVGSGCSYSTSPYHPQPCILYPSGTIGQYTFNQASQFLNPGEVNHSVVLALPWALPDPYPAVPQNTVIIATSRGNIFSFQWPIPLQVYGQSQSAFSSGIMKIAYTGTYDSANEPGLGGTGTASGGYCHTETSQPYPAGVGYAEKLTGITGYGDSGVLWFVNPWLTYGPTGNSHSILTSINSGSTTLYIYVIVINTGQASYTPTAGSIDLAWYSADHLNGNIIGIYYKGTFYKTSSSTAIAPGSYFYAIYQIATHYTNNPPSSSVMFWGDASITDGSGSNSEDQSYFSGTVLLSGLWIRYEATTGSC